MLEVSFHQTAEDAKLRFAVIVSRADGRWVFCRHKERDTFECPGGRREAGESIDETARRELYEETGALEYTLKPLCAYSVSIKSDKETEDGKGEGKAGGSKADGRADDKVGNKVNDIANGTAASKTAALRDGNPPSATEPEPETASYGMLYYAEIQRFGPLPVDSEIGRIDLLAELPEQWTYPLIQPHLLEKVRAALSA